MAALVLFQAALWTSSAARLDLGRHVGELELHRLELRDRPAELLPLLRVGEGQVVGALREPDAHGGDRDAAAVEDLEELVEAADRARRAGSPAGTARRGTRARACPMRASRASALAPDRRSRRAVRDDDVRDLAVARRRGGDRDARRDVGPGVGDEHLRAVDDPPPVAQLGARRVAPASEPASGSVRPNAASAPPDASSGSQPASAPRCRTVDRHVPSEWCAATVIATDESIRVSSSTAMRVRHGVGARAAVLLRDRHAHQPELGHLRDELVREPLLAVELGSRPARRE